MTGMLTSFRNCAGSSFSRTPLFWIAVIWTIEAYNSRNKQHFALEQPKRISIDTRCSREHPTMRAEPLLTIAPLASVGSMAELYAIALMQAETAAMRYERLAQSEEESFGPVRCVFEVLTQRERERADSICLGSGASQRKRPDPADLRWKPTDLVPVQELSDVGNSSLSTAYHAWALAVRHRERTFIFWTYVAALATDHAVRSTAEDFAREALIDGNILRRERRLAWRSMRQGATDRGSAPSEPESAALLESLLLKDVVLWSQQLTPVERDYLSTLRPSPLPPVLEPHEAIVKSDTLEDIKRRALRRAEQLSNLYLDEADRAADQNSMEYAQNMAAQSIARLAGLRSIALASTVLP
ncbi:hypothetical protein [Rhodopseudomonas sp.]|uniref:hypothetical protein n=1 Tax=Rhodopseudomonas sp. TaxID=1078 RepID=UPI0034517EFE